MEKGLYAIDKILAHEDTRTIPCITRRYALNDKPIIIKTEISDSKTGLEESLKRMIDIINGKKSGTREDDLPLKIEITASFDNYKNFFMGKWGNRFDYLKDKSFITPKKTGDITNTDTNGWKKDASSGRSYYFVSYPPLESIIHKGADLLKGDKFREYPENYFAPPMIGSETLNELEKEYTNAALIQEFSIRLQGRATYAPHPIYLNELNNFVLESGEIVPFKDYLNEARKNKAVSINIFKSLFRAGVDCMAVPEEHKKKPFEWAISKYIEKLGPHGTYLYSINGLNTRLIDSKKIKDKNLEEIISKQYPDCRNEEEICNKFMRKIGEYYGIALGNGLTYKRQSECLLVDTTLGGVTMDIGDLEMNPNQEAYLNTFLASKSTAFYFYKLLNQDSSFFLKSFEKSFVKTFFDYMHKSSRLIEDANLKNKVSENMSSLEMQIDDLIEIEGPPLREKFVSTNLEQMFLP